MKQARCRPKVHFTERRPRYHRRVNLETALSELEGLTPQRVRQLERFGLRTVGDLLTHFPKRHEDRTRFDRFPDGETAEPVCICGLVKKTSVKRIRGHQKMFDVMLEDENAHALSAPLVCRWFNAHWVEKASRMGSGSLSSASRSAADRTS
jgi:ATP-dependent DNA helicase RecG